ncbi:MAG: DUF2203 family protein [Chloroflexi bacterium]|nr:DUF2203 family protein [Chloroflexota bacterium]
MTEREFTLEEAREALAAARPAFEELREVEQQIGVLSREIAQVRERSRGNGRAHGAHERETAGRLTVLGERARRLLAVITEAGAEVKGLEQGLLDFPTTIEGRPAYWCWQAGEPDIAWWHPRESGFAGRRPIDPAAPPGSGEA